jgi:hypothetical protein
VVAVSALRLTPLTIACEYSDEDALCFLASHLSCFGKGMHDATVADRP